MALSDYINNKIYLGKNLLSSFDSKDIAYNSTKSVYDKINEIDDIKANIINILKKTKEGSGLNNNSTWEQIIAILNKIFPDRFDVLKEFTSNNWTKVEATGKMGQYKFTESGISVSINDGGHYAEGKLLVRSNKINISGYSKLHYSARLTDPFNSTKSLKLICGGTTKTLIATPNQTDVTTTLDVSNMSGECYFEIYLESKYDSSREDNYKYISAELFITNLVFEA